MGAMVDYELLAELDCSACDFFRAVVDELLADQLSAPVGLVIVVDAVESDDLYNLQDKLLAPTFTNGLQYLPVTLHAYALALVEVRVQQDAADSERVLIVAEVAQDELLHSLVVLEVLASIIQRSDVQVAVVVRFGVGEYPVDDIETRLHDELVVVAE